MSDYQKQDVNIQPDTDRAAIRDNLEDMERDLKALKDDDRVPAWGKILVVIVFRLLRRVAKLG